MGRIIVAGSINMDVVAQVEHLPKPGETLFGRDLHYIPGGKGSNQAVAAARLSNQVALVGKLGRDSFGQFLHDFLSQERLNLDYLSFSDTAPTGVALITLDAVSENTIVVISGSNYDVSEADVAQVVLHPGDTVLSVFEIPQTTIRAFFQRAREAGATTILNAAPAAPFQEGVQDLVDTLIVNEVELAFFAESRASDDLVSIRQQAHQLRTNAEQTIIVTLGANGVACLAGDRFLHVEGIPVEAVDTTGAGDCFVGALAVALSEGHALEAALRFANTAASLSVQQLGAAPSLPHREAVERALG